ncbi:hypothetical protein BDR03DRAFT_1092086 [Suillus americanus]|nr:hypothetical protein BDR03DRAFT_1092086 [Suillus americanus]
MSPHPAVIFLDPLVTDYNSMDVNNSSMGWESLDDLDDSDDLYLGLDDDIEYDTMSAGPPDALAAIPDQSDLGQADDAGCLIDPDLYLGPEDNVIDVDELPDAADPPIFDLATSEVSIPSNKLSTELPADQPELDYEEVRLMARELHPFGKYQHPEYQSIRDRLRDYTCHAGGLPDPSLQQLLEAECYSQCMPLFIFLLNLVLRHEPPLRRC